MKAIFPEPLSAAPGSPRQPLIKIIAARHPRLAPSAHVLSELQYQEYETDIVLTRPKFVSKNRFRISYQFG